MRGRNQRLERRCGYAPIIDPNGRTWGIPIPIPPRILNWHVPVLITAKKKDFREKIRAASAFFSRDYLVRSVKCLRVLTWWRRPTRQKNLWFHAKFAFAFSYIKFQCGARAYCTRIWIWYGYEYFRVFVRTDNDCGGARTETVFFDVPGN